MNLLRKLVRPLTGVPCRLRHYSSSHLGFTTPLPGPNDHVYVAMSAGVDSSVTAALMAERYKGRVTGVFMRNWSPDSKCAEADWNDVQQVCAHIDIPAVNLSLEKEYWLEVFEPMLERYRQGLTPNPDVSCNRYIKFGSLKHRLKDRHENSGMEGDWWLATGHYARVMTDESGTPGLFRPKHLAKDQSYYLSSVNSDSLRNVMFPLSDYLKPEIREMAHAYKLHVASKPDSQGLCFVSQDQRKFRDFLSDYISTTPGNVITEEGEVVGQHNGLWNATVGQKSGICLPQGNPKYRGSWFVKEKNIDTNELVIVKGGNHPSLFSSNIKAKYFSWLGTKPADLSGMNLTIQFRSLMEPVAITNLAIEGEDIAIRTAVPVRAVSPGQNLVLYHEDRVLGCGVIV
ncbi:tRNA-specific 2-thiouridylase [Yarrowia lipolytica]|jgi:tRNA (5-methylaminomethyl-2-thiouridylate)-methyltransferase|uniref:tRNA-5-taurinomethyluridine 2-sulfurtransferase n=2 Tax=Yarrowia lipolytica TaxID=4952 RepID=Q6C0F9_YARLI|nr:YALI0F25069p [Yarrowia lipolytica CLIB122]AOW07672.1 hypothetical protein YALI1_F32387g [Yarrowia lipolytica]KAB8284483.1 tRNA-specific 2-thiouridylase [Yarrowia lipolytica]KAE8174476.1 tRNA-specific 2-thiouridylase [Yarrowia lipolytica]KAJ8055265.1 tRNA-specific 2-thiouridylase [Yarrowia lipolytica]QNP99690.1 Mitochondrial tRNA-specific 2-thiouridylase 1 [Yarrowia lipolytica]|eukprot:XP_505853.1 YALI0F25069p [Yarrowia lipolytica CLIB122]